MAVGKQNGIIIRFWETAHPPTPPPTFSCKWEVSVNVGLGKGYVGSFPEMYNAPQNVRAASPEDKLDFFVFLNASYIPWFSS